MARLYSSRRWQRERLVFLNEYPLCHYCEEAGRVREANVVDHIKPHKGDYELFWNQENWQALCTPCHASVKQIEENGGVGVKGYDDEGYPII